MRMRAAASSFASEAEPTGSRRRLAALALGAALLALAPILVPAMAAAEVTLKRGLVGSVETLDPHKAATFAETEILIDLFEGLVTLDALGRPIPGAAESWTVSPDGLVYTFQLRDGARWSNGEQVKASDFVASFRRLFDPATNATEDGPLQVIRNAALIKQGMAKADTLGVAAPDVQTLEITLDQPTPTLPLRLARPAAFPVNVASIKKLGADFGKTGKIVSNGPFRIGAVDAKDGYMLLKNDSFRTAGAIALDGVVYRPFEEAGECVAAFAAAEVASCDDVPVEALAELKAEFGPALRIAPYAGTYYYAFNLSRKPFDDVRIRRALAMAIDRQALAQEAWSGGMVTSDSLVPAGLSLAPADAAEPLGARRDAARKLLAEAGYGGGKPGAKTLTVEIRVGTGAAHEKTARLVAEDWKAIGVEATIVTQTNADHFRRLADRGEFDVARAGWIVDEADPADMLRLLRSDNERFNYSGYDNPAFDSLLDRAAVEADPLRRQTLIAEAEAIVARDEPVVPLLGYASLSLVSPQLKGWQANPINEHPSRFLSLEP